MEGSRYLMHIYNYDTRNEESYCLDVDTFKAERLELDIDNISSCFIEGDYMPMVRYYERLTIYKHLHEIGQIDFDGNHETCKYGHSLSGRYAQQVGHTVYAVHDNTCLFQIEWQDIKDGMYCKTFMKSKVRHFYVDRELGQATVLRPGYCRLVWYSVLG